MNARIHEIFKSVQGEGRYAGVSQVFVRFFGCCLRCVWCDTPDSYDEKKNPYTEYSLQDLLRRVLDLSVGCHSVSLTGGEPLVQAGFLKTFLPRLKKYSLKIYLETNGILLEPLKSVLEDIDIISMDIKLPSSAKVRPCWDEHRDFLKIALAKEVFVKTVISSDTTLQDVLQAARLVSHLDRDVPFYLQPNSFDPFVEVTAKCRDFQNSCLKYLSDVRILPQCHKLAGIR